MRGRATFQVTTKDSVFAIKVWMFEMKDSVLEMPSAKYYARIELLNVLKDSWNIWSDEQDYEIRRPDVAIVERHVLKPETTKRSDRNEIGKSVV